MATATTPVLDSTTLGDWVGFYGGLGQQMVNTAIEIIGTWPVGWGFATSGTTYGTYGAEGDVPQYLYSPDAPTFRIAGCWYGNPMTFTITPPDAGTYQLALYECFQAGAVEPDPGVIHYQYSIEIIDDATSTVLQSLATDYYYYKYIVFQFSGTIRIVYTGSNAVTTGVFLDAAPAGESATPAAVLLASF